MSDNAIAAVLEAVDSGLERSLGRLFEVLRIPSVSTDRAFAPDCRRAAEWAATELRALGFDARVAETAGQPAVLAHRRPPGARKHVLFYGHYDVQPPDPLDLWTTGPFDPQLIDGAHGKRIVARGSSDDKGQFMSFVEAARAWIETHGELPVGVTVLLEGEEETGSPSLPAFFAENKGELAADLALICDTNQWDQATPAVTTRLRGLVYEELIVTAANRDLHSGMYGGAAQNPIRVLAGLIAALHDETGRVAIPGFYDGVGELIPATAEQWRSLGFDDAGFLREVGLTRSAGERDRGVLELLWARPTCEANGIVGGYTGEGSKTVIPSRASAKISFRLVSRQDPDAIRAAFHQFVRDRLPADAKVEFLSHASSPALELSEDSPALAAAARALTAEWGKPPVLMGSGGSIPIVGAFKRDLGMDALMVGFALDDDKIHSPNEKYELSSFHKGIRSWARILAELAAT
jgi:acetylornithine deacetylase/succinyl-diaminopimelate desuccinylase-like protein